MATSPPEFLPSDLGARIMQYRQSHQLTQADLAGRYNVSGPAIFKFEKGYVTPSLQLWCKMAEDFGIPERQAILLWAREKLPPRYADLLDSEESLGLDALTEEILSRAELPGGDEEFRKTLANNSEVSPALKKFVANDEMWSILKVDAAEVVFLVHLDAQIPRLGPEQFRDAILNARDIRGRR